MELIVSAFLLGILGSLHCVGMCGPIALMLPMGGNNKFQSLIGSLFYNGGRIFTYSILGILFGSFGNLFELAGWQQKLSIALGVIILIFVLIPIKKLFQKYRINNPLESKIQLYLSNLIGKKGMATLFIIGFLNGLLPCGLIYMALAGATATAGIWSGAIFMVVFGLGTFPVMFLIPVLKHKISFSFRQQIKKAYPIIFTLTAVLLIVRGLGLGIPYLSPEVNKKTQVIESCCKKETKACCKK